MRALTVRRRARLAVLAAAAGLATVVGPAVGLAHAAKPTTFTWSGADDVANGNANWSDAGNWQGGVAPVSGSTAAYVFPALACVDDGSCSFPNNDLNGLTVTALTIVLPGASTQPSYAYGLSGNGITLAGPLATSVDTTAGPDVTFIYLSLPIALSKPGKWTMSQADTISAAAITGAEPLTIKASNLASLELNGGDVEVGKFAFTGTTKGQYSGNGNLAVEEPLNGASKAAVTVTDASVATIDTTTGSLTTSRSQFQLGSAGGGEPGTTTVNGKLTFDKASYLAADNFGTDAGGGPPVPGTDYPVLDAHGAVNLASIHFAPTVGCDVPVGTVYTFITGTAIKGIFTDNSGAKITNGGTVRAVGGDTCTDQGPLVRINYTTTSVTLTVTG